MADRQKIVILGLVGFLTAFGAHIVAVNLPVYAEKAHVGLAMVGLLIAIYDFAEILAKPVFGVIADRKGMKATLLAGIAVFTLASLAYLVLPPQLLIVVRLLQGLGAAALSIVSAALVAAYFPEGRGRAFGIYNALKGAGYVVSPIIGGAIVWASNFRMVFLATAAAGAVTFLLSLRLPEPRGAEFEDDDDDLSLQQLAAAFRDRDLLPWYAIIVVNMFLVGILFGFLAVYGHSLGYNQLQNGLLVATATGAYLLIQPAAGTLADRFDPIKVMLGGLILSAAGVLLIPFTSGLLLFGAAALGGIGVGTVWTNSDAMVSSLAEEGRLGATLGAAGSFKELGDMLGPLLIGVLAEWQGVRFGFVVCGLLGLGATALLRWVPRPARRNRTAADGPT